MPTLSVRAASSTRKRPPGRRRRLVLASAVVITLGAGGVAAAMAGMPARTGPLAQATQFAAMVRAGLVVHEVTVEGRANTASTSILAALDVQRGDLMLEFDPRAARQRLEAMEWIAMAEVRRELPGRIHVRITERRPFAFWQRGGELAVIDRGGRILTADNVGRFAGLPVVAGAGAARTAGALMDALSPRPRLLEQVRAAVRVGGRRWDLHFDTGLVVRLPEQGAADAWLRFARLEERYGILAREVEAVDLRLADRLFIRLRPENAAAFGLPAEDA